MKIAGRKLSHLTTIALFIGLCALGLGIIDWMMNARSSAKLDLIRAGAVRLDGNSDLKALEGRIVYAAGVATGSNETRDTDFNLSLPLLRLERQSEILQWHESGGKHRRYEVEWGPDEIDTRTFRNETGHENRGVIEYPNYTTGPMDINLVSGQKILAHLDRSYLQFMGGARKVFLTEEMYEGMPDAVKARFALVKGSLIEARDGRTDNPKIGDNRTRFLGIAPMEVTIVGVLRAGVIAPGDTEHGQVAILRPGVVSIDEVYATVASDIRTSAIIMGIVASLVMFAAIFMAFKDYAGAPRVLGIIRFGR